MNQLKSLLITVLLLTNCSHAATYRYTTSDIIGKIQYQESAEETHGNPLLIIMMVDIWS